MNLAEKIKTLCPDINEQDFINIIRLQNDSDGRGDYIAKWDHPTYAQPTQEQLDALENVEFVPPPVIEPTPLEKLQSVGLTVDDLKQILGLK